MLFDAMSAELNKNASRFQVSSVIAGEKEGRGMEWEDYDFLMDFMESDADYMEMYALFKDRGLKA